MLGVHLIALAVSHCGPYCDWMFDACGRGLSHWRRRRY